MIKDEDGSLLFSKKGLLCHIVHAYFSHFYTFFSKFWENVVLKMLVGYFWQQVIEQLLAAHGYLSNPIIILSIKLMLKTLNRHSFGEKLVLVTFLVTSAFRSLKYNLLINSGTFLNLWTQLTILFSTKDSFLITPRRQLLCDWLFL